MQFIELLKKEIHGHLLDYRYVVYAVLSTVLILASFGLLKSVYVDKMDHYTGLADEIKPGEKNLVQRGYWLFTKNGVHYTLKPEKLQVLAQGVDKEYYKYLNITTHRGLPFLKKEAVSYPLDHLFPSPDFCLIVSFVLSLLVFIFSYGSIVREREEGTLKLLLSYPISRTTVICAKLVAGYAGVVLPLVFSFLGILLYVNLASDFMFTGGELVAAGIIFGCAALYLLIMYLTGMLVSTRSRTSGTAASALLLVWLVFIIIIHNVSLFVINKANISQTMAAMDTRYVEERTQAYNQVTDECVKKYDTRDWFIQNWRIHPEDKLNPHQMGALFIKYQGEVTKATNDLFNEYSNGLAKEARILSRVSLLSPSLIFNNLAADIANTGLNARVRLFNTIPVNQDRFFQLVKRNVLKLADEGKYYGDRKWTHRIPVEEIEEFQYSETCLEDRIRENLGSICVMIIMVLGLFTGTVYAFGRTEVDG